MFPDLEKILGQKLPSPDQLHTDEARAVLDSICVAKGKCFILPATVAQHGCERFESWPFTAL